MTYYAQPEASLPALAGGTRRIDHTQKVDRLRRLLRACDESLVLMSKQPNGLSHPLYEDIKKMRDNAARLVAVVDPGSTALS